MCHCWLVVNYTTLYLFCVPTRLLCKLNCRVGLHCMSFAASHSLDTTCAIHLLQDRSSLEQIMFVAPAPAVAPVAYWLLPSLIAQQCADNSLHLCFLCELHGEHWAPLQPADTRSQTTLHTPGSLGSDAVHSPHQALWIALAQGISPILITATQSQLKYTALIFNTQQ